MLVLGSAALLFGAVGCRSVSDSPCSNEDGALDSTSFVFVSSPRSGERVSNGFKVTGCARSFESNVIWRLSGRDGVTLAAGTTRGGGVDGPRKYSFTVSFTVSERQIGHLEVFESDPSEGEGFAPTQNLIPLVLGP